MITSWKIIAEQCIKLLEGKITADSKYDIREVIRLAKGVANKLLVATIRQAWLDGEKSVDTHYIATFRMVEIKTDETLNECYTDLPSTYIYLYNHTGIQRVVPVTREKSRGPALIPIAPYEMDIYVNLPAGSLDNEWAFEPDRDKIWFKKDPKGNLITKKYTHVDITLISTDLEGLKDTDPLPIPSELFDDIIRGTLEILAPTKQIPVDTVNDNNPNIMTNGR
jgi:hypothetical protein